MTGASRYMTRTGMVIRGRPGTAIGIAKIIFVVAIILFLISAVMHLMRRA